MQDACYFHCLTDKTTRLSYQTKFLCSKTPWDCAKSHWINWNICMSHESSYLAVHYSKYRYFLVALCWRIMLTCTTSISLFLVFGYTFVQEVRLSPTDLRDALCHLNSCQLLHDLARPNENRPAYVKAHSHCHDWTELNWTCWGLSTN